MGGKENQSLICPYCAHLNPAGTGYCEYCGSGLSVFKNVHIRQPSKVTAAILAWFLGLFGIHRLYIGRTWSGVFLLIIGGTGLVLTIAAMSWFSIMLMTIAGIWAIVDFITIVCGSMEDGKGGLVK